MCGLLDRILGTHCSARLNQVPAPSSARSVTDMDRRVRLCALLDAFSWSRARDAMPWSGGCSPVADMLTSWDFAIRGLRDEQGLWGNGLTDLERPLSQAEPVTRDRRDRDG